MILITGCNGLIGSAIATQLLSEKKQIRAIYRRSMPKPAVSGIEWVACDILDVSQLSEVMQGVTEVIHAAAVVSFAPKDIAQMYKTNVEGTANVVNACLHLGVKKLLYISSIAALGRPDLAQLRKDIEIMIDEDQKWTDSPYNSHYAKSKYLGELEVWRGVAEGLSCVVLNPSVVLGESDWNRSSTQLFKYVHDRKKFYTDGLINYVDVRDVARIASRLLDSDIINERFVVSGGTATYQQLFEQMAQGFDVPPPAWRISPALAEVIWRIEAVRGWLTGRAPLLTRETARTARTRFVYNAQKIKTALQFEFSPLAQTVERVCDYLTHHS